MQVNEISLKEVEEALSLTKALFKKSMFKIFLNLPILLGLIWIEGVCRMMSFRYLKKIKLEAEILALRFTPLYFFKLLDVPFDKSPIKDFHEKQIERLGGREVKFIKSSIFFLSVFILICCFALNINLFFFATFLLYMVSCFSNLFSIDMSYIPVFKWLLFNKAEKETNTIIDNEREVLIFRRGAVDLLIKNEQKNGSCFSFSQKKFTLARFILGVLSLIGFFASYGNLEMIILTSFLSILCLFLLNGFIAVFYGILFNSIFGNGNKSVEAESEMIFNEQIA